MTEAIQESAPGQRPRNADLFARANKAYDAEDYEGALALLNEAVSKDPENVVALNNKGAALDALGKREAAEACYRKALSLSSDYELAWHNLGNCLFAQEEYGGAAKAYAKATELNPERMENFIGLAESHSEMGNRRRASAAIARMPKASDDSHLLMQADLYLAIDHGEKAASCCEQYIELHPDDAEGHAHLGGVRQEMGNTSSID